MRFNPKKSFTDMKDLQRLLNDLQRLPNYELVIINYK